MKEDRDKMSDKWFANFRKTGYGYRDINQAFEDAGAVGLISSYWSKAFGVSDWTGKIFKVGALVVLGGMLWSVVNGGMDAINGADGVGNWVFSFNI